MNNNYHISKDLFTHLQFTNIIYAWKCVQGLKLNFNIMCNEVNYMKA